MLVKFVTCFALLNVIAITMNTAYSREIASLKPKKPDGGELMLVQLLFRHGDRTPISVYRTDPYANYSFPEGLGELTSKGKERLFKYGKVLARRYKDYLESFYTRNVIAQSSPLRRCLETNEAFLSGMFPPTKNQIWSHTPSWPEVLLARLWNPIGISTVEVNRSWKINPDAPCPAATNIEETMIREDPVSSKFFAENAQFMKQVKEASGFEMKTWKFYGFLFDAIFTEQNYFENKFIWPKWLDQLGPDTLQRLSRFNDFNFRIYGRAPEEFFRLRTGALMREMVDNLKNATANSNVTADNKKVYTYSSHDTMIGYILNMFGLYKDQPSFGSGLIYELRRDQQSNEPMVHLFYANVTDNFNIYKLKLNESSRFASHCSAAECSIQNFERSLQSILDVDPEKDCQLKRRGE